MNPALNRNNARLAARRAKHEQAVRKANERQTRRDLFDSIEQATVGVLACMFLVTVVVIGGPVAYALLTGGAL